MITDAVTNTWLPIVIISILVALSHVASVNIIPCSCENQPVTCPVDDDCQIDCNQDVDKSCKDATITCPDPPFYCSMDCLGKDSCRGVNLNIDANNPFRISCSGRNACQSNDLNFYLAPGADCIYPDYLCASGVCASGCAEISGYVFEDVDNDGVDNEGLVIDGGTVALYTQGPNNLCDSGTGDDVLVTSTTTANGGQFSFTLLPGGTYCVVVDTRSIITLNTRSLANTLPGWTNQIEITNISASESVTDVVFGYHYTDCVYYELAEALVTWFVAHTNCQNNSPGGKLASVHSLEAQNLTRNLCQTATTKECWIGFISPDPPHDKTSFFWVDGSVVDFDGWNPNFPAGADTTGTFAAYYKELDGWTDAIISTGLNSICQVPTPCDTPGPTPVPTPIPTPTQTVEPSPNPSAAPSPAPTLAPTVQPSPVQSPAPSAAPTLVPTVQPSPVQSTAPSAAPTPVPTAQPSPVQSTAPSAAPTPVPTAQPSPNLSQAPSPVPSSVPSPGATPTPTQGPTPSPTPYQTEIPTPSPTVPGPSIPAPFVPAPSVPGPAPLVTAGPTVLQTQYPTFATTKPPPAPIATAAPTVKPPIVCTDPPCENEEQACSPHNLCVIASLEIDGECTDLSAEQCWADVASGVHGEAKTSFLDLWDCLEACAPSGENEPEEDELEGMEDENEEENEDGGGGGGAGAQSVNDDDDDGAGNNKSAPLEIILPVVFICLLICVILVFCMYRKRQKDKEFEDRYTEHRMEMDRIATETLARQPTDIIGPVPTMSTVV